MVITFSAGFGCACARTSISVDCDTPKHEGRSLCRSMNSLRRVLSASLQVIECDQERIKGEGAYNVKYRKIEHAALNLGDYIR